MNKVIIVVLGCLAAFLVAEIGLRIAGRFFVHSSNLRPAHGKERILCLGDSFTYGQGAPEGGSYPSQLERMLTKAFPGKYQVINEGIPGFSSSLILKRADDLLTKHRPSWIILLTGNSNETDTMADSNVFLFMNGWSSRLALFDAYVSRLRVVQLVKWIAASRRPAAISEVAHGAGPALSYKSSNPVYEAILKRGEVRAQDGDYRAAMKIWNNALQIDPNDLRARLLIVDAKRRLGLYPAAQKDLKEMIAGNPSNEMLLVLLLETAYYNEDRECITFAMGRLASLPSVSDRSSRLFARYGVPDRSDRALWAKVLRYNIQQIVSTARRHECKVIMMNYPEVRNAHLQKFAHALAIPFIDQEIVFNQLSRAAGYMREELFVKDGHCTSRGYGIMAGMVRDFFLCRKNRDAAAA